MFAVVYKWKIKADKVQQFQENWAFITDEFIQKHGGLGSCLHQTDDGMWVAYARWPNRESWEKPKELVHREAFELMKDAIEESFPAQPLNIVQNKLV